MTTTEDVMNVTPCPGPACGDELWFTYEELRKAHEAKNTEFDTLRAENQKNLDMIEDLESKLTTRDEIITHLKRETSHLISVNDSLTAAVRALRETLDSWNAWYYEMWNSEAL